RAHPARPTRRAGSSHRDRRARRWDCAREGWSARGSRDKRDAGARRCRRACGTLRPSRARGLRRSRGRRPGPSVRSGRPMTELLERLEVRVRCYGANGVLVALSGGVDSAVVTAISARALGPANVNAVTAVSPSYPAGELEAAGELASEIGVAHRVIETYE